MCDAHHTQSNRRDFLKSAGAAAAGTLTLLAAQPAMAEICTPFDESQQTATTPDQAIRLLMDGNARFAADTPVSCDLMAGLKQVEGGQHPFACVLGCMDSRVSPELVFDQHVGDIFVARVAGNIATTEVIGSLEYAVLVAGAKAIMVLGHNHCGAVKGALDQVTIAPNLTKLLAELEPAIAATPIVGERSSHNLTLLEEVTAANVRQSVADITEKSEALKKRVAEGTLKIVGAVFDLSTGKVTSLT